MIVLSILAYLTPTQYVLEKKDEYKKGYIEENFAMDGKSLTGLLCLEEEHYEGASVATNEK